MIQHIKKASVLSILLFLFISCKFSSQEHKSTTPKTASIQQENLIDGYWSCVKYEIDSRFSNSKYGINYANEFKDNFSFTIKNDSITIGNCKEELYQYKYNLNSYKATGESVFGIKSNSQNSIKILSTYEEKSNTCFPLDNLTMYHSDNNQIIIHDKGYFFYYDQSQYEKESSNCKKEGILGNTRNYWNLECHYSKSIDETYKEFLKTYPYTSIFLLNKIPTTSFTDNENNITYNIKDNKVEIYKSDPSGIIYISFEKMENETVMKFEMKYPEY